VHNYVFKITRKYFIFIKTLICICQEICYKSDNSDVTQNTSKSFFENDKIFTFILNHYEYKSLIRNNLQILLEKYLKYENINFEFKNN
jgi:hypothetical protein